MVARCETKQAAASDELSRRYYELCAKGWRRFARVGWSDLLGCCKRLLAR